MKLPSRSLVLTVVVFLIAAAAAAWWIWPSMAEPTVSFIGFREEKGERVALFSLRNPGSRTYEYHGAGIMGEVTGTEFMDTEAGGFEDSADMMPHSEVIMTLRLPLASGGAEWVGRPFRLVVSYEEQTRERLSFLPSWLRSWLPKSMLAPTPQALGSSIIWSEVVTP
jgi:hypothetical protein